MNLVEISCRKCGGKLKEDGTGKYKCAFCGGVFYEDHLQREIQMLNSILDGAKQEKLSNLRKLLWKELQKEYTDSMEIISLCKEIKKIYPEDFYANLYEALNGGNDREVNEFIDNIDEKEYYEDIPDVLSFMMKSLRSSYILSVGNLIERAYGKDRITYEKYMTEFEKEAEKVEQGLYDPSFPRDVFIMYSSADMIKVKSLAEYLESQGLSCFVAARNLQHGRGAVANYQRALETAMDNCHAIVFVSSSNSRSMKCDVIRLEMPYVKNKDLTVAPIEYRNRYDILPDKYKKPRIEYVIESYTGKNIVERVTKEFFGSLQWAQSEESVAERVMEILLSKPEIEDENAKIMAALQEAEERRKEEEARRKKEAVEAEEKRRKEAEEAEERRQKEIEELRRNFELQLSQQRAAATVGAMPAEGNISGLCRRADDYLSKENWKKVDEYGEKILDINFDDPRGYVYKLLAEYNVKTKGELENVKQDISESPNYIHAVERGDNELPSILNRRKAREEEERKKREEAERRAVAVSKMCALLKAELNIKAREEVKIKAVPLRRMCGVLKSEINRKTKEEIALKEQERKEREYSGIFDIKKGVLKSYKGQGGNVVVPDCVASIGDFAFEECSSLVSVVIPDSVKSIGMSAFSRCSSLVSVSISESVTSIGSNAFCGCGKLERVNIPSGVTSIEDYTFSDCKNLKEINIPSGVKSIGERVFADCNRIKGINIPESVTFIDYGAFLGWTKTQKIYCEIKKSSQDLPEGWDEDVFDECQAKIIWGESKEEAELKAKQAAEEKLRREEERKAKEEAERKSKEEAELKAKEEAERQAKEEAERKAKKEADRMAKEAEERRESLRKEREEADRIAKSEAEIKANFDIENGVLKKYKGNSAIVVIPDRVKIIGDRAFELCQTIISVTIPKSVTSIQKDAFSSCYRLVEVYNFSSLKISTDCMSFEFGGVAACAKDIYTSTTEESKLSVDKDGYIFRTYKGYPSGRTEKSLIGYRGNQSKLTLPEGITTINKCAFYDCKNIVSVTIPKSVTSIGNGAFSGCTSLAEVYNLSSLKIEKDSGKNGGVGIYAEDIYTSLSEKSKLSIDKEGFVIHTGKEDTTLIRYIGNKRQLTVPIGITKINGSAFSGCDKIESVLMLNGVREIGEFAFSSCASLKSVTIPESVTSIGNYVFFLSLSLLNVTIPKSVKSIGRRVFSYWTKQQTIYCETKKPLFGLPQGWDKEVFGDDCKAKIVWGYKKK